MRIKEAPTLLSIVMQIGYSLHLIDILSVLQGIVFLPVKILSLGRVRSRC